ncbi:PepSY-associated TM helix domain-containing protein, partial [Phenylobacterium sp.]|uniref:PepSY-associated TM helix domain-containing protein n=1 Tax=Phenylobacterium sp. TaxID=1871053 RepID=UPI002FE39C14
MRTLWVAVHRWLGLSTAAFLFIAGLTGAVISWDHELDGALNPGLYDARTEGPAIPTLALAQALERARPELQVTWAPIALEPGEAVLFGVESRPDPATGKARPLDYNQVAMDPATGEVQGQRFWGRPSLSRENLLPFL